MWADIIGLVAGFLLMLPAAKDNIYRFREAANRNAAKSARVSGMFKIAAEAWKQQREGYSAADSLCIGLGGVGLMVSFGMKLAG